MSEVVVIAFEVVEIEHHDRDGTVSPASGVEFVLEELLHVAAAVETGERVADCLHTKRFTQVKVGNRDCDVFGDGGSELDSASKDAGVRVWARNG